MNEKAKQALVAQIIQIATNATKDSSVRETARRSKILGAKGFTFCLVNDIVDLYEDVCRQLLKRQDWSSKFSEKYISSKLHRLLAELLENDDMSKASEYVGKLIYELESFSEEQLVLLPLTGIAMLVPSQELGRITLRNISQSDTEELFVPYKTNIAQSDLTPTEQAQGLQRLRQEIYPVVQGRICAEFRVIAEAQRAIERAEEECRRVLDLLWYAIPLIFPRGYHFKIGLWKEATRDSSETLVLTLQSPTFLKSSKLVGPNADFILNEQTVQLLERIGVFEMAEILKKPVGEVQGFEETLLRGIHWFANAQIQVERENDLLGLMTCLETFLTSENSDKISNTVAEGVAFVLGNTLEERKNLKKQIKNFYNKRSRISHGGQKAIFDSDLEELRTLTGVFLAKMIQRKDEFKERKDLDEWIEGQKLS